MGCNTALIVKVWCVLAFTLSLLGLCSFQELIYNVMVVRSQILFAKASFMSQINYIFMAIFAL